MDNDSVQEYGSSIRRHFLNDIIIAYERYATIMFASYQNNKIRIDPAVVDSKIYSTKFEELNNVYEESEIEFISQLRRLRNSIVHYNSVYNISNKLDYKFGNQELISTGNEGNSMSISFNVSLWIYNKLLEVVENVDKRYFNI